MREIKFRVWDKKHKIMTPRENRIGYCNFSIETGGKITRKILNETFGGIDESTTENQENYIVQQFTGLKDKNGKDIYEGDILKTEGRVLGTYFNLGNEELPAWPESKVYTWIAKVIWCQDYASFLLEYIDYPDYRGRGRFRGEMIGVAPWAEILGNIFENSELLNSFEPEFPKNRVGLLTN